MQHTLPELPYPYDALEPVPQRRDPAPAPRQAPRRLRQRPERGRGRSSATGAGERRLRRRPRPLRRPRLQLLRPHPAHALLDQHEPRRRRRARTATWPTADRHRLRQLRHLPQAVHSPPPMRCRAAAGAPGLAARRQELVILQTEKHQNLAQWGATPLLVSTSGSMPTTCSTRTAAPEFTAKFFERSELERRRRPPTAGAPLTHRVSRPPAAGHGVAGARRTSRLGI